MSCILIVIPEQFDENKSLLHTPDEAEKQKIKDSLPNLNFYKAHSIKRSFAYYPNGAGDLFDPFRAALRTHQKTN